MGVPPYSFYLEVRSFKTSMHAFIIKQMDNWVKDLKIRVPRGMLLGFIVSERGIEANPEKIAAITNMGPSRTWKAYRGSRDALRLWAASSRASAKEACLCTAS
jgi:hypothetical protein